MRKAGKKLINDTLTTISSYDDLGDSTRAYEDLSIPDFIDRALNALSISHPDISLMDLGRLGAREAAAATRVDTDEGHGVQFLLLNTMASVHLDPRRFNAVLAKSAQLCMAAPELDAIAKDAEAMEGLARSTRMLYESLTSFEAILLREDDEQALMRRIIKFYGEIYEDVAGPVFAWYNLLAGIKSQTYAKLVQSDVADLARGLLRNSETSSFLEQVGANLRNAAQHGNSFSLQGDTVIFRLRSYQDTVSRSKIIDEVFSLLESLSALSWSLSNALTQSGSPVPLSDSDATYMRLTPFRLANLWLRDRGTNVLTSEETQTSWKFTLDADLEDVFELALALALGVPEPISKVGVRSCLNETTLIVPFSAYNRLAKLQLRESDPKDHLVAMLHLRNECRVKEQSLLSGSDLKFATGCLGLFLLNGDNYAIPYLRQVLTLATSSRQPDVASLIKEVFVEWRRQDAQTIRRLGIILNSWRDQSPAPTMPHSRDVVVVKNSASGGPED